MSVAKVARRLAAGTPHIRVDRRVAGASIVDEPLQELLALLFRDYVHTWFDTVSDDPDFVRALHQTTQARLRVPRAVLLCVQGGCFEWMVVWGWRGWGGGSAIRFGRRRFLDRWVFLAQARPCPYVVPTADLLPTLLSVVLV